MGDTVPLTEGYICKGGHNPPNPGGKRPPPPGGSGSQQDNLVTEYKQQVQELKRRNEVDLKILEEVSNARDILVKQNEKLQAEKQELLNELGKLQSSLKASDKKEKEFCKRIEGLQKDINTAENALYNTQAEQKKFCELLSKEVGLEGVDATIDTIAKESVRELKRRGTNQERAEQDAINLTIELNNLKRLVAEESNKRVHTVNIR